MGPAPQYHPRSHPGPRRVEKATILTKKPSNTRHFKVFKVKQPTFFGSHGNTEMQREAPENQDVLLG